MRITNLYEEDNKKELIKLPVGDEKHASTLEKESDISAESAASKFGSTELKFTGYTHYKFLYQGMKDGYHIAAWYGGRDLSKVYDHKVHPNSKKELGKTPWDWAHIEIRNPDGKLIYQWKEKVPE